MDTQEVKHDPYAVLRIKEFRFFIFARFITTVATLMQSIIVGWQIYEMTKDEFLLGLTGLFEAIPFIFMALFSGHIADKFSRKKIIISTMLLYLICVCALLFLTMGIGNIVQKYGTLPFFIIIAITGLARALIYPSQIAVMAQIVPKKFYANSSTWNSAVWQIAAVVGPAIGGLTYKFIGVQASYFIILVLIIIGLFLYLFLKKRQVPVQEKIESLLQSLSSGIKFVFKNQILLSALSLDMFAVLFGGAVAMIPVFADRVLHIGIEYWGIMRSAPAIGAVVMSIILAYYPPVKKTGIKLFLCVTMFGVSMILFALSKYFMLSMVLLILSGMFDTVSVIIRQTIIQLFTPNNMRGRVAAVNSIFIGSSNEIGSFESGLAARILGLIPSVIFGGSMTLLIAGITAKIAPVLRKMDLREKLKEAES